MTISAKPEKATADFPDIEEMVVAQGYKRICGIDEVGRGPLAGPVVAAAVILPRDLEIAHLADSKKLTPERRAEIFEEIINLDLPCAIGIISHEEIDRMNIHRASLMAMRKALIDLPVEPDIALVDGPHGVPNIKMPQYAIVDGDDRCKAISAASIIAKVTRDRIMDRYEELFPRFSFASHKGYCTPDHLRELKEHGPCEIHRKTFKPVADLRNKQYALL